jgi:hypothetical protein
VIIVKKRWYIGLGVSVLAIILLFVFWGKTGDNPFPIAADAVERIELKTYSHSHLPGETQAVLREQEVKKVIRLFNQGTYDPEIEGEPCCATYWLEVYLKDGTMIRVSQGIMGNMTVKPVEGERYWVHNRALVRYVKELVKAHDLVSD